MKKTIACDRMHLIEKLREMNFYGPVFQSGHEFMLYHGNALVIPPDKEFSIAQFRFLLKEVENIVSKEEWLH